MWSMSDRQHAFERNRSSSLSSWSGVGISPTSAQLMAHSTRSTDLYDVFNFIPTLRQTKPRERPEAAICVRKSSARRVLHFTPLITASCVLHRPANRVIHRLQLYCIQSIIHMVWYGTCMLMLKLMGIKRIVTRLSRHCDQNCDNI